MLCCAAFLLALAHMHSQIVSHPVPLDLNEAAFPTVTATIASGESPYSFKNQPARMSLYPVLYNIVVVPFSLAFGNSLELHRAINGVFILACCLVLFLITKNAGGSILDSIAASAIFYAGLLFNSTPIASANGLGLLLFLTSIFIPWHYHFSNRSLLTALILGALAFYTKQYFVACLGYVALYLFIAVSKKKAIVFGLFSLLLIIASLAVVNYFSPYYADNTIFGIKAAGSLVGSSQNTSKQLLEFGRVYLALLGIAGILAFQKIRALGKIDRFGSKGRTVKEPHKRFNLTDIDAPLLSQAPDYLWLCFACSMVIILFSLGKNPGNHMTYLFQLMSPFLLAGIFSRASRLPTLKWLTPLLATMAFYSNYAMLSQDFSVDEKNWNRLRHLVSEAKEVYAPTALVFEIIRNGGEVYQNGHTSYFPFAQSKPIFFAKENPENSIDEIWKNYVHVINQKINDQEFDLIILDQWTQLPAAFSMPDPSSFNPEQLQSAMITQSLMAHSQLKNNYRRSEVISLSLTSRPGGGVLRMSIWEPLRDAERSEVSKP